MTGQDLASLFERDLCRLVGEIQAFEREEDLWNTFGSIRNPAGNLALHIIGGTNFLFGTTLAHTGYIRNRDLEFTARDVKREVIVEQLEALIPLIHDTVGQISPEQLDAPFPIYFDKEGATHRYVFTQLLLHLNYHLGQVNYLRRGVG